MPERNFTTPDSLSPDRPVAIYGAGENGMRLARALEEHGITVSFFLSTYDSGTLEGREVRIFEPDAVRRSGCKVVVASYMWKEIADSMDAQGFTDYAVSDPNLPDRVTAEHMQRVIENVDLFRNRKVLHATRGDVPASVSKLVLHDSEPGSRLELDNTLWEGRVEHHNPGALESLFQEHPADMAVLVQHRDMNPLFIRNCIRRMPARTRPVILTDIPRRSKVFLLREQKAVYFILPKCASSTIMGLLQSMQGNTAAIHEFTTPDTGPEFIDPADPKYADWFKFTFVRHPLKRFASLYNFYVPGLRKHILYHLSEKLGVPQASFRQLAEFIADCPDSIADPHFRSQYRFVTDAQGTSVLDFTGRVDAFQKDWAFVADRLGLDPLPEKRNYSRSAGTDYSRMYDDDLEELIRARYAEDFRMFFPEEM